MVWLWHIQRHYNDMYLVIYTYEPLRVGWCQGCKHHQKTETIYGNMRYLSSMIHQCQSKAKPTCSLHPTQISDSVGVQMKMFCSRFSRVHCVHVDIWQRKPWAVALMATIFTAMTSTCPRISQSLLFIVLQPLIDIFAANKSALFFRG